MVELLTGLKLETELEGHITSPNLIHHSYNKLRAGSCVVYCCYYLSSLVH
jgi:hypothetical protein